MMLRNISRHTQNVSRLTVRCASTTAAAPAPAKPATVDPEHQAWLKTVTQWPVKIPTYAWTLEWALPTPVPLHQFTQTPIVIEVKDRNPDADNLVYHGPNVIGGYSHPVTGQVVSQADHAKVMKEHGSFYTGSAPPTE